MYNLLSLQIPFFRLLLNYTPEISGQLLEAAWSPRHVFIVLACRNMFQRVTVNIFIVSCDTELYIIPCSSRSHYL